MKINTDEDIEDEDPVFRVGFPMGENHVFDKILTNNCRFTGKTDFFRPTITDPGYEGLLYDTSCPAWYGDSGEPVFAEVKKGASEKPMVIHGVLTHTFEVNFAGEIEESSKETDSIGEYVKTSNFSPFRLASDFFNTLDEEERLFQQRNPKVEEKEEEGESAKDSEKEGQESEKEDLKDIVNEEKEPKELKEVEEPVMADQEIDTLTEAPAPQRKSLKGNKKTWIWWKYCLPLLTSLRKSLKFF